MGNKYSAGEGLLKSRFLNFSEGDKIYVRVDCDDPTVYHINQYFEEFPNGEDERGVRTNGPVKKYRLVFQEIE